MRTIILIVFLLINLSTTGQDTTVYVRMPSSISFEGYLFIKSKTTSQEGSFVKYIDSDDGQNWIGNGKFKDDGQKLELDEFWSVRTRKYWHLNSQGGVVVDSIKKDSSIAPRQILLRKEESLFSISATKSDTIKYEKPNRRDVRSYIWRLALE